MTDQPEGVSGRAERRADAPPDPGRPAPGPARRSSAPVSIAPHSSTWRGMAVTHVEDAPQTSSRGLAEAPSRGGERRPWSPSAPGTARPAETQAGPRAPAPGTPRPSTWGPSAPSRDDDTARPEVRPVATRPPSPSPQAPGRPAWWPRPRLHDNESAAAPVVSPTTVSTPSALPPAPPEATAIARPAAVATPELRDRPAVPRPFIVPPRGSGTVAVPSRPSAPAVPPPVVPPPTWTPEPTLPEPVAEAEFAPPEVVPAALSFPSISIRRPDWWPVRRPRPASVETAPAPTPVEVTPPEAPSERLAEAAISAPVVIAPAAAVIVISPVAVPAPVPVAEPLAQPGDALAQEPVEAVETATRTATSPQSIFGLLVRMALVGVLVWLAAQAALGALNTPTLGSAFGATYQTLPADQRQALDARFAAVAGSLRGSSGADLRAKVQTLVDGGMPRLDDSTLAEHQRLWAAAFSSTDSPTCAAVARAALTGKPYPPELDRMLGSLGPTGYGRWLEILVTAMEAQVHDTPAARAVDADTSDAMFARLFGDMAPVDVATMSAEQDGIAQPDDAVCAAQRNFLAAVLRLVPADLVTYEIWSVAP